MFEALSKHVFGTVLPGMGLLCRAGNHLSNSDCAALRAMTGSEGERAVRLFVTFGQLLKLCSAIQNLTIKLPCGLRRIDLSLSQQLSNCAAGRWVNHLFYNTTTPIGVFESAKTCSGFHKHIRFENISPSFYGRFSVGEPRK
jgi:hypothetical protein